MNRTATLLLMLLFCPSLFAASGGPDTYGYIWRDSNEPDGPVYNWIDISTSGELVTGLGDDNIVGPFVMLTDHPFYWYSRKFIWIGSNGYVAFNPGNIASPFPLIPQAGGVNDYIAAMTADLTFGGANNPGRCYFYDTNDTTIISYVGVPFWTSAAPGTTGSNTFQIILNKVDASITLQYQQQTGTTQNNDLLIGIESVAGTIGLQHSADLYPPSNFAIRFYRPEASTLEVADATVAWNTEEGNGGRFLSRNGALLPLVSAISNIGNVDLTEVAVLSEVRNANNVLQVNASTTIAELLISTEEEIPFGVAFTPATAGIYRFTTTVSGIPDELVTTNNARTQELVVVDTTALTHDLKFTGLLDDGLGLGWDGGNGGVAMHLTPPYHPAYASATTVRIASNTGLSGFSMKVYADDGPNGTAGTLLDSVTVLPANVVVGDQVVPLSAPLTIVSGGVYVLWYMNGPNINVAQDIVAPFSLRTYEVLDNTWAEYRDRENVDFHIGLQLTQAPVFDIGVSGFFGVTAGQNITDPLTVRTWVTNYGNQPAAGFPLSYRFANGPVVTQSYSGTPINPGQQVLFSFSQPFDPDETTTGELCGWSSWDLDLDGTNDTTCVAVNVFVGLEDMEQNPLRVWPNPARTQLHVGGLPDGLSFISLFDAQGRCVLDGAYPASEAPVLLDLSGLQDGMYHMQVVSGKQLYRTTAMVQR